MEAADDGIHHQRLESINKARACPREEANTEIGTERNTDGGQDLEAWGCATRLDPGEVRSMDADHGGEIGQRKASVQAQVPDLLPEAEVESAHKTV
jgi:hypothetical protein